MSLVARTIWDAAAHPIGQSPSFQKIGSGAFLLRNGLPFLWGVTHSNNVKEAVARAALGLIMSSAGAYLINSGGSYLWDNNMGLNEIFEAYFSAEDEPQPRPMCHTSPNPKNLEPCVHAYESFLGDESLKFDPEGSLPKTLVLGSGFDSNGALKPTSFNDLHNALFEHRRRSI